jgi:hypothetical protein
MKQILIFCEGVTDQVFIADCLELIFGFSVVRKEDKKNKKLEINFKDNEFKGKVTDIGGCDKLLINSVIHANMQDNKEEGGENIVIFDADYTGKDNGNKGIASCRQKLNNIRTNKEVDFHHYIWPDDENDGEIETLLRELVPQSKEPIFKCIDQHQDCLKSLDIDNLRYADLKNRLGFYLYTSNEDSEARKRNYKNADFWNLNPNKNENLNKFISFLKAKLNVND